ncbi:MAG: baseplate wedge protein 53 [Minisyncoccia bacterium]
MANNSLYPATSPYKDTGVFNGKFLDFMVARPIPKQPSDALYTIPEVYQYRPDMLAFDLYNDSRLWWVFAARNPNRLGYDPYFDFKTGIEIYIPKLDTLKQVLGI